MTMPTVAVLDFMPPASRDVITELFGTDFEIVFVPDNSAAAKRTAAADATVLLTMWGAVDADTLAAAPKARLVQKLGVGVDKIDSEAAAARGVVVLKAAGINAEAVAELAVLLTLAVGRNLPKATEAARTGQVVKEALRAESFQLLGKTVGLLGLGHIGQAVARRLGGFGVELIYHDLRRAAPEVEAECAIRYVSVDELVATADVLSLHLPSTPATDRIIGADVLSRTKPGLILINTARGSLVDEHALAQAIKDGRVLGAGLDVTETEPIPADSPLLGLERVVLTPHVGGAVANNFPRVIGRAHRNARAVLDGGTVEPADIVVWPAEVK
ncbi:2-hydroxyacid dehydrogenase [Streptomyces sp. AcH 505]|uniref:NAD(P)-dependent oxidoreductase n=2 Tax=unclassified Streptomyces TaxID=2593676 RepID=UPI0012FEE23D